MNDNKYYEELLKKFSQEKRGNFFSMLPWFSASLLIVICIAVMWIFLLANVSASYSLKRPEQRATPKEVEELKNFIEKTTIEELRSHVSELQKIKQVMAQLRDNNVNLLKGIELELHQELPADLRESMNKINETILQSEAHLLEAEKSFKSMISHLISLRNYILNNNFVECNDKLRIFVQEAENFRGNFSAARKLNDIFTVHINNLRDLLQWLPDENIYAKLNEVENAQEKIKKITDNFFSETGFNKQTEEAIKNAKVLISSGAELQEKIVVVNQRLQESIKSYEEKLVILNTEKERQREKFADTEQKLKLIHETENNTRNEIKNLSDEIKKLIPKTDSEKKIKSSNNEELKKLNEKLKNILAEKKNFEEKKRIEENELKAIDKKFKELKQPELTNDEKKFFRENIEPFRKSLYENVFAFKKETDNMGKEVLVEDGISEKIKSSERILSDALERQKILKTLFNELVRNIEEKAGKMKTETAKKEGQK